ncbi:MAG: hypothetical protein FD166_992 [Bacteroidetes bacterium]|nr:MAG: hypothetical protein FD166_992 [Bacteroidota bacterium]
MSLVKKSRSILFKKVRKAGVFVESGASDSKNPETARNT